MSTNKVTVLACPFCRYDDVEIEEIDAGVMAVTCPDCGTIGPHPDGTRTAKDAIEAWNNAPRLHPLVDAMINKAKDSACSGIGATR